MTFNVGDRVLVGGNLAGFGPGTIIKDLHKSPFHSEKVYGIRFDSYLSYDGGGDYHSAQANKISRIIERRDDFSAKVSDVISEIKDLLVSKNKAYGNSALDPIRIFSQADPVEQLKVRIDDKLSRLQRGDEAGEDTVADLIGYLVLLQIAKKK